MLSARIYVNDLYFSQTRSYAADHDLYLATSRQLPR